MSTNGVVVWNREGHIMPNGRDIGSGCPSSTQSALIVPHPGNANRYYVFSTDCKENQFQGGLRYSIIDISLDNGMGDVVEKNILLAPRVSEKVAAVFHPDGHNLWVVTHGIENNTFMAFLITDEGLQTTPILSATGQVHAGGRGYLKFSPDGKRLAAASFMEGYADGIDTELFTFDGITGRVVSDFVLPNSVAYSLSFSPSSKLLYTSCAWTCGGNTTIIQYNLEAGSVQKIADQRYVVPVPNVSGALQLGVDGLLYYTWLDNVKIIVDGQPVSTTSTAYLGVFTNPNGLGSASGSILKYIAYPCGIEPLYGLPNFIESYFQTPVPIAPGGCAPMNVAWVENVEYEPHVQCSSLEAFFENTSDYRDFELTPSFTQQAVLWIWNFGDGTIEISEGPPEQISHRYAQPGTYLTTLTARQGYECTLGVVQKEITVGHLDAKISFRQDCQSLEVSFSAQLTSDYTGATWHWDFGDASNNTSAAQEPTYQYSEPGDYPVIFSAETSSCGNITRTLPTHVHGPLQLGLSFIELCQGDALSLRVPDDIPGTVQWSYGSSERSVSLTEAGEYWVQIMQDACVVADTVTLSFRDCVSCSYSAPNVITPNGDDKNDTFVFQAECSFLSYRMNLYDRWGHRIYTTTSPVWDGHIHNEVPATGVYYYTIELTHMGPRQQVLTRNVKGWLQIFR